MNVVGIIPARYGSTRLPGKPLRLIHGRPMLQWVYERVRSVKKIDMIYTATDDERIKVLCNELNIPVIMTSENHRTAANRLAEVAATISADFYVQINGDEPLIEPRAIEAVIPENVPQDVEFGTNIITEMKDPSQVVDASNIKMVFDVDMNALYMSRTPIPYPFKSLNFRYYKHVGIIGYNRKMLRFYADSKPGRFEIIEGIDTLRFLDYGKQLRLSIVENCRCLSVDTEKDLEIIEQIMKEEGYV